jgi:hypothetical protein
MGEVLALTGRSAAGFAIERTAEGRGRRKNGAERLGMISFIKNMSVIYQSDRPERRRARCRGGRNSPGGIVCISTEA